MAEKFVKDKSIKKEDYKNKKGELTEKDLSEFEFDKKTDIVPNKTNQLICILFSDDKGCYFLRRKMNSKQELDYFRFKKGMYIIDNESIHITKNNVRVAFYLEGISTPIKMSNIDKEVVEVEYTDLSGNKQKSIIQKIKGLKFDSKILDIFANRRFAEIFTKQKIDNFQFYLLIFSLVTIVMVGIGYGVSYVF